MINDNETVVKAVRSITRLIASAGSMKLIDTTGIWPRFLWMGSEMSFDGLREADSKEIEYSLIERRGTLKGVNPEHKVHVERDIAGFERLSKSKTVLIVRYVNIPELSASAFDRVLLGLEFFVDPESEFVQLSALPLRPR